MPLRRSKEGREGVKWQPGFAFFRGWEMGFSALGLGFMKKNNRKMGMGFNKLDKLQSRERRSCLIERWISMEI